MTYRIDPAPPPTSRFVAELCAALGPRVGVERHGTVAREFTPVTGGTLIGPNIDAMVQPGGGDWSTDVNGIFRLDARYPVQTADGTWIEVYNRGIGHSDPALFEEIVTKGGASLDGVYFRTVAQFFTDSPDYQWLSTRVHIGIGRYIGADIIIHFYEVD